jgi:hypothetical protein
MRHYYTRSKASPYRVAPTDGPMGVVADSLDEAKAAFRAAGERHPGSTKTIPSRRLKSLRSRKRLRN